MPGPPPRVSPARTSNGRIASHKDQPTRTRTQGGQSPDTPRAAQQEQATKPDLGRTGSSFAAVCSHFLDSPPSWGLSGCQLRQAWGEDRRPGTRLSLLPCVGPVPTCDKETGEGCIDAMPEACAANGKTSWHAKQQVDTSHSPIPCHLIDVFGLSNSRGVAGGVCRGGRADA
jgi:hypothetical protein